jgi:hypothetical protein
VHVDFRHLDLPFVQMLACHYMNGSRENHGRKQKLLGRLPLRSGAF